MSSLLTLEKIGHTALIEINHPPANTWNEQMLLELKAMVEALNQDQSIYTLVIIGAGEKFFSAGADLHLFADADKNQADQIAHCFGEAFATLSAFRGVSIAAINGYAMGGGLECALACDFRLAETHAVMALPEASVGLLPCAGGTQNLTWLVGEGWAKRMILLGQRVEAQTAFEIGLVTAVVPAGQSRQKALELAAGVERQSPASIASCKALIHRARQTGIDQTYSIERGWFVELFDSPDQQEGVSAFLERRRPIWKNA